MKRLSYILWPILLGLLLFSAAGCTRKAPAGPEKLKIVTTIFPVYDFARQVAGEHAEVSLLLPPGLEPHHFEPRPADVVTLSKADIFIFTNKYMEPWAEKLLAGAGSKTVSVVEAGKGVTNLKAGDSHDDHGHEGEGEAKSAKVDPHVWLDFANAQKMVGVIAEALAARDPAHAADYRANAAAYDARLAALDEEFKSGLASCRTKVLVHGGHYAFGYLTRRYDITYRAAYPVSADAEPGARELADLVGYIRKNGVRYIFSEELVAPRVAQTLAGETGAEVIKLHGAHNITKEELQKGATFVSLMQQNLQNLKKGLGCATQ